MEEEEERARGKAMGRTLRERSRGTMWQRIVGRTEWFGRVIERKEWFGGAVGRIEWFGGEVGRIEWVGGVVGRKERQQYGGESDSRRVNDVHNHVSESDKKRRRSSDDYEDVWTEHKSSSGRIYFYNKHLDKSQWEKPKGLVKKSTPTKLSHRPLSGSNSVTKSSLNPRPHHSSSSSSSSSSGKGHSHRDLHSTPSRHHSISSSSADCHSHSQNRDRHRSKLLSEMSSTHSSSQGSSVAAAVTSPYTSKPPSAVLSPTTPSAPCTPTPALNHTPRTVLHYPTSESTVMSTPTQYMMTANGSEAMPVQGWVIQHPSSVDNTGLHPLQQALLLQQQQYVQGQQQIYIQPNLATPTMQPFSPMVSAQPTPSRHQPSTPMYTPRSVTGAVLVTPQAPSFLDQPVVSTAAMRLLQTPMSNLGKLLSGDKPAPNFPDPSSLKLPPPSLADSGDLFCRPLAESWWTVPLETCLRGIDRVERECLSRTTVDSMYHSGQLAKNLLALECCRIKTVSRSRRLSDLRQLMDDVAATH